MIRDITIGQYYPQTGSQNKACRHSDLYCVYIFVPHNSRLCGGYRLSGGGDQNIQSSGEIYFQGPEGDFFHPSYHHGV